MSPEPISLTPGAIYQRSLAAGQTRRFRFESPAGQYLHLTVEQRGIDVIVLLRDPSGRLIFEVDNPIGASGMETVVAVTPAAGKYRLEVEPFKEEEKGSIVLTVRRVRTATSRDRQEAAGSAALFRAERRRLEGDFERAVPAYREALPHLDAVQRREEAAEAYWHLGDSLIETGALTAAAESLEHAAARFQAVRDPLGEARALNRLGTCRRFLGDPRRALEAHERSLLQFRAAGWVPGEAAALNNLSLVLENSGHLQDAIERYEEALGLWRKLGKKQPEAVTLQNLGRLHIIIGHDTEGMDFHQQALKLVRDGKPSERVPVLIEMGWANYLMGRPEVALVFYDEALNLAKTYRDRIAEAGAWDRRGTALRALRRFGEADASFTRALEISRAAGNPVSQAHTLANLGWLDLDTGTMARGRNRLRKAAEMFEAAGDPNGELAARVGLSRAARKQGDLGTAREEAEAAVRLVEELRAGLQGSKSRGQFLATRYDAFEELAALLMDLDRREPGKGHAREALEVAERARARGLLEDMGGGSLSRKAGEGRGGGPSAGDGGEGRALQAEIRAMDARRESLVLDNPRDPRLKEIDAQLRQRAMELDRLTASRRESSPGFKPLDASQIQSLADEDTLFVVYLLAEPESFAWTVDRNAIEAHVLPGRKRIEKLARHLVGAFSQSRGVAAQGTIDRASRELSEALLSPLGQRLKGHRRLAILADGALHLVPFAALADREIVMLPSATFLAEQRRRLASRKPAPGAVAVLADPVFSPDDERASSFPLARGGSARGSGRGGQGVRDRKMKLGSFQRLPFTKLEAEAILRLAPEGESLSALGTDANLDLVESGVLGRYQIVHFATHGLLHPVLPERSGIVLSLVDEKGRPRDGFLPAPDVAALDLPVELVVLSACETALGREMRGEGLVGLTQAFFQAGARRVVVSTWKVQDRATAELMKRFYRGLLVKRLPPAAALRAAQLSIRSERKWSAPYFWAGFSLHGDWN